MMRPSWLAVPILATGAVVGAEWRQVLRERYEATRRLGEMVIVTDPHQNRLGSYYYHHPTAGFTFYGPEFPQARLEGDELPRVPIAGRGEVVTPTSVAQVALDDWNRAELGAGRRRKRFLYLAENLCHSGELRNEGSSGAFLVWPFEFRNPWFPASGDRWISGLTSGLALSVLLRAYQHTGHTDYMKMAERARAAYDVTVERGGIRSENEHGVFFEEVPTLPYSRILNGHLFAMLGLYDYIRATSETSAADLFRRTTADLAADLCRYSHHGWSYYDDPAIGWSGLAPVFYQKLHVLQLRSLARLTADSTFSEVATTWDEQARSTLALLLYTIARQWYKLRRRVGPPPLATVNAPDDTGRRQKVAV